MKKILAAAAAAALVLVSLSGCGGGENKKTPKIELESWKDISGDTVVARLASGDNADFFDIRFDEFYGEYLFYLVSYNISDDMAEADIDTCESFRNDIITFLTLERMFLYAAENEYGISENTLTAEQKSEIQKNADEVYENWKNNCYAKLSLEDNSLSESERDKKAAEMLESDLDRCGLDKSIFYKWEYSAYIQELVIEKICDQAEVTDGEVTEMFESYYNDAVDAYKNDKKSYEKNSLYLALYLPEGTRRSAHIFIPYNEEDTEQADESPENNENSEEAPPEASPEAADQAAKPIDGILGVFDEIRKRLDDGEDFTKLQETYSPEEAGIFTVIPDSELFPKEYVSALYELAAPDDVSEPVASYDGGYIIMYCGDAVINSEDTEHLKDDMRQYLLKTRQNDLQNQKYIEWTEKYEYDIDYDLLKLTKQDIYADDTE